MTNNPDSMEFTLPKISEDNIYEAMKSVSDYLDITPEGFKLLYRIAFQHAMKRIQTAVRAKDIMTKNVISGWLNTPVVEIASMMAENHVSGIPILNETEVVMGLISEKDLLRNMNIHATNFMELVAECLKKSGCEDINIQKRLAKDIMTSPVITVKSDTPIIQLTKLFHEKGINRVPVVSEENKLIGILSRADLVKGYAI